MTALVSRASPNGLQTNPWCESDPSMSRGLFSLQKHLPEQHSYNRPHSLLATNLFLPLSTNYYVSSSYTTSGQLKGDVFQPTLVLVRDYAETQSSHFHQRVSRMHWNSNTLSTSLSPFLFRGRYKETFGNKQRISPTRRCNLILSNFYFWF